MKDKPELLYVSITSFVGTITTNASFYTSMIEKDLVENIKSILDTTEKVKFFSVDTTYINGDYKGKLMLSKHLLESSVIDIKNS